MRIAATWPRSVCPTPAHQIVFQESLRAVDEQVERLHRLEQELLDLVPSWRLYPMVEALQALRGVQWIVALTVVAELGDLTRFDNPRQLAAFVGRVRLSEGLGLTRAPHPASREIKQERRST